MDKFFVFFLVYTTLSSTAQTVIWLKMTKLYLLYWNYDFAASKDSNSELKQQIRRNSLFKRFPPWDDVALTFKIL
jgi:hypothetical protein